MNEIYLTAEISELTLALNNLSAELVDAGDEFVDLAVCLVKMPAQLISFEDGGAVGTTTTILLKPSQLLLDFMTAVQAADLNGFLVIYPHLKPLSGLI